MSSSRTRRQLPLTRRPLSTDIEGVASEFAAVNDYLASLDKKFTHKLESYAEHKARCEVCLDKILTGCV